MPAQRVGSGPHCADAYSSVPSVATDPLIFISFSLRMIQNYNGYKRVFHLNVGDWTLYSKVIDKQEF